MPVYSYLGLGNTSYFTLSDYKFYGYIAVILIVYICKWFNVFTYNRSQAQDVNLAMEASRKSQIAFAAAKMVLAKTGNMEVISSIKKVLDVGFHDVKRLLQLIHLAMENLSRTS